MSGCYPTEVKCNCICHEGGTMANPQPYTWCCKCKKPPFGKIEMVKYPITNVELHDQLNAERGKILTHIQVMKGEIMREIELLKEGVMSNAQHYMHQKNRIDSLKNAVNECLNKLKVIEENQRSVTGNPNNEIILDELPSMASYLKDRGQEYHKVIFERMPQLTRMAHLEKCLASKNEKLKNLQQNFQELQTKCGEKTEKLERALRDLDIAIKNEREAKTKLHWYEQQARESKL